MLTREVLKVLYRPDLSGQEKSIIIYVADKTVGYHCQFREISAKEIILDLKLKRSTCFESLQKLVKIGVFKKRHIGGKRYEYGLNDEFFGRIYPGEINNVRYLDRYKKSSDLDLKVHEYGLSSPDNRTVQNTAPATSAARRKIKHISNIVLNISLLELKNFVAAQTRSTKGRWERFISETLSKNPQDERLLWSAIERVYRTQKDFFGKPVRSAIGLFENSDWTLVRESMITIAKIEAEEEQKRIEREKNQKLLEEQRQKAILSDSNIDLSNISPFWRRIAEKGMK